MPESSVKARLRSGGYVFGTWLKLTRNPALVRHAAEAGFDFVYIDMEMPSLSWETVADLSEMARAYRLPSIVRLYDPNRNSTSRALNIGATGVIYHDVETREDVDRILDWVYHSKPIWRSDANAAETIVAIQLESRKGAENASSILRGGVDIVEVGRGDLSTDMGYPLQRDHPEVSAAVDSIIAACREANVAPGVTCIDFDDREVEGFVERGFKVLSYATDGRILEAAYRRGVDRFTRLTARVAAR